MTPTTHPEELLAAYTDGMLDDGERAEVEAHLAGCASCREELELARTAVRSLVSIPEEPVPMGVMNPVTAELGRRMARPARRTWTVRLQWTAGLAAAAALVGLLAVTLPRLGNAPGAGGGGLPAAERAPSPTRAQGSGLGGRVQLEDQSDVEYDAAKLQELAEGVASVAVGGRPDVSQPQDLIRGMAATAEACVARAAAPSSGDQLVRLIQARYEGTPAYLGVYLRGPGAGQAPTKVEIWAVARSGCAIVAFASQRL